MTDGPGSGAFARAAILVGGASTRLGRDKARELVGGVPLVERVASAVRAVVPDLFLVGKAGAPTPLPGVPRAEEDDPVRSALAGLRCALAAADSERLLVVGCDHPFLARALLRLLLDRLSDAPAAVPRPGGRPEPLVAAFRPAVCLPEIDRRLRAGNRRLSAAVAALGPVFIEEAELREADPGLRSFVNVNDEATLARARRMATGEAAAPGA